MKINSQQYAQGLYELLAGKKEAEAKKLITDFLNFLVKNNDIVLADKIINSFNELVKKEAGELEIELVSARPLSKKINDLLKVYLNKKSGAESFSVKEKINEEIIGGFILRYNDRVVDGSLKQNLLNFQKQLSN
ncbi:MAG TPA: ATP synthase F1 subunit delta [Patescibacteria group bacterium]|nr:ATP synthase F1 subunit delta [Patescibacteria group bacterium]